MATLTERAPKTLVVVDNHDTVCLGVEYLSRQNPDEFLFRAGFPDVEPLIEAEALLADIVVLDLMLGRDDTSALGAIPLLVSRGYMVVVNTTVEAPAVLREAVRLGASGVALKNDQLGGLLLVLRDVAGGGAAYSSETAMALLTDPALLAALTEREVSVLRGVRDGLTRRQIASRIGMAEHTMKDHLDRVKVKYAAIDRHVTNAGSMAREAQRDGWLDTLRSQPPRLPPESG